MAYLKKLLKYRVYDVFGPSRGMPRLVTPNGSHALIVGKEYLVSIPKAENFRWWASKWNKKRVTVTGFVRLFFPGDQIVCIENNKNFLTLPSSWLSIIKKSGCSCSTSTIWSKGCQCGGA